MSRTGMSQTPCVTRATCPTYNVTEVRCHKRHPPHRAFATYDSGRDGTQKTLSHMSHSKLMEELDSRIARLSHRKGSHTTHRTQNTFSHTRHNTQQRLSHVRDKTHTNTRLTHIHVRDSTFTEELWISELRDSLTHNTRHRRHCLTQHTTHRRHSLTQHSTHNTQKTVSHEK